MELEEKQRFMNNSKWKQRKKYFSTGFRRLGIEKRKSLFHWQKNNFLIPNWVLYERIKKRIHKYILFLSLYKDYCAVTVALALSGSSTIRYVPAVMEILSPPCVRADKVPPKFLVQDASQRNLNSPSFIVRVIDHFLVAGS